MALESDITTLAGGNAVGSPRTTKERKDAKSVNFRALHPYELIARQAGERKAALSRSDPDEKHGELRSSMSVESAVDDITPHPSRTQKTLSAKGPTRISARKYAQNQSVKSRLRTLETGYAKSLLAGKKKDAAKT